MVISILAKSGDSHFLHGSDDIQLLVESLFPVRVLVLKNLMTEKVFCPECQKEFVHPRNLLQHRKVVHEGIRYYCQDCSHSYTRQYNLTHHRLKAHPEKVPAEEIKYFKRSLAAIQVRSRPGKLGRFQIRKPGSTFGGTCTTAKTKFLLVINGSHPLSKPAQNDTDGAGGSATAHVLATQTQKKPLNFNVELKNDNRKTESVGYGCLFCPFTGSNVDHLKKHAGKHGQKMTTMHGCHRCKFCDYTSEDLVALMVHARVHFIGKGIRQAEKEYELPQNNEFFKCLYCDRQFSCSEDTENHEKCHLSPQV